MATWAAQTSSPERWKCNSADALLAGTSLTVGADASQLFGTSLQSAPLAGDLRRCRNPASCAARRGGLRCCRLSMRSVATENAVAGLPFAILPAVEIVPIYTNPKRKRGNDLATSLTLRVSVNLIRARYKSGCFRDLFQHFGINFRVRLAIRGGDQFFRHQEDQRQDQRIDDGCCNDAVEESMRRTAAVNPRA